MKSASLPSLVSVSLKVAVTVVFKEMKAVNFVTQ